MRAVAVMLAFLVVAASGTAAKPRDPWKQLRRALHLPTLAAGEPCPLSDARTRHGLAGALGADPPYPLPFPQATLDLGRAKPRSDGRWAYAVRWLAPPRFSGRALIRSRRLDRPGAVGLAQSARGHRSFELKLSFARSRRWQTRGRGYVVVPSPGCYGFQVDGLDFSNTVVFQARLAP